MSIEKWALLAGGLAVLVAVVAWWFRRRAGRRRIPRYAGKLGHRTQNREFIDFLTKNRHRRVLVDIWLDDAVAGSDSGQPADQLRLVAPNNDPSLRDECEITIRVDDRRNSPLSHEHGVWRLNGYVAVEGRMGVWQGVPSYHLVAIPRRTPTE